MGDIARRHGARLLTTSVTAFATPPRRYTSSPSGTTSARFGFRDVDVVDVRQSLVDPPNSRFAVENALVVDVDGDHVTVGAPGAFPEDYEAEPVTLERADD